MNLISIVILFSTLIIVYALVLWVTGDDTPPDGKLNFWDDED